MFVIENFDNELKHPFLRSYTLDAYGILIDTHCIDGVWLVSSLEDYNYALHVKKEVNFVKLRRVEEPVMYISDYIIAPPRPTQKGILDKKEPKEL